MTYDDDEKDEKIGEVSDALLDDPEELEDEPEDDEVEGAEDEDELE